MGWQEDQKAVATGVTDGTIRFRDAFPKAYNLEEINAAFDKANTGSSGGATNARAMINSYIFGY